MSTFKASFDGADKVRAKIADARAKLVQNVSAELYDFGNDIINRSEPRVPIDTGFLAASKHVDLPVVQDDVITVILGYNADYALPVHENLSPTVHWKRPGSGPKYLEQPAREMEHELPGRIADAVKRTFE